LTPEQIAASPLDGEHMNIRLEHKHALVTGGNSGIGAAIGLALADSCARVVINYVSHPEAAERLVQTVTQKHGEAIAIQADVSDPDLAPGVA
jgi:glucose 1-dehydrogenase